MNTEHLGFNLLPSYNSWSCIFHYSVPVFMDLKIVPLLPLVCPLRKGTVESRLSQVPVVSLLSASNATLTSHAGPSMAVSYFLTCEGRVNGFSNPPS